MYEETDEALVRKNKPKTSKAKKANNNFLSAGNSLSLLKYCFLNFLKFINYQVKSTRNIIKPIVAATAEITQKRITILDSGQPIA